MYSPSSDLAKQHIDLLLEEVEHDRLVGRARAARRRRRRMRRTVWGWATAARAQAVRVLATVEAGGADATGSARGTNAAGCLFACLR
jgi:hypothetical protein